MNNLIWILELWSDIPYECSYHQRYAVFDDPAEAMIWADEEMPPQRKDYEWHWDLESNSFIGFIGHEGNESYHWELHPFIVNDPDVMGYA